MADGNNVIQDVNRYSAAVIGVVLLVLGGWGLAQGFGTFNWLNPGW